MSNSKNINLFKKVYPSKSDIIQAPFACQSALNESQTSFDVSGSDGDITDSNGDILSSIDLSQIHSEGLTEYYTETKILGPQSAYLLQGNVTGETYAAQAFPIVALIQEKDNYEAFINVSFTINYVSCSQIKCAKIDTYRLRNQPGDVCAIIQSKLDELGIPVAVSIKSLDVHSCDHLDCCEIDNQIDYLVFQSTLEGYNFYVYNVNVSAVDSTYENFDRTWADYTDTPFVGAVINFDTIMDLIRSAAPRLVGQGTPGSYDQVPCDLYKYFISIVPMAVSDAGAFMHNFNALTKFEQVFDEDGHVKEESQQLFVTLAHLYPDIYAYYFGYKGGFLFKYNIHDIIAMLRQVSDYVNSSNIAGPYKLIEDFTKRLGPQKYPNGALRGIVLVPEWPDKEESGIEKFAALRLAHVADSIIVNERIDVPENMRIEGYYCNGCKDVFIRHDAVVKVNTLLQTELEVYNQCPCALPVRKVVSNEGLTKCYEDDVWTYKLHKPINYGNEWTNRLPEPGQDDNIWTGGQVRIRHDDHHKHNHQVYKDEYVDDYHVPSKYDWMAQIPMRRPDEIPMEPHQRTVGLYGYMQHLSENDMWTKVGDGYMNIGLEDDYQSKIKNLQSSVLIYNPNPVPVRVRFMVFS